MRAVKTIVATGVAVLALGSAAVAGAQHVTTQNDRPAGSYTRADSAKALAAHQRYRLRDLRSAHRADAARERSALHERSATHVRHANAHGEATHQARHQAQSHERHQEADHGSAVRHSEPAVTMGTDHQGDLTHNGDGGAHHDD
jgi:hypothetical protein